MSVDTERVVVSGVEVEVIRKTIKHLYIRVYAPDGRVRVSVPKHVDNSEVLSAVSTRLSWIREQRSLILAAPRPTRPKMVSGERHYVWGRELRLSVVERPGRSAIELDETGLSLHVPQEMSAEKRQEILYKWYRQQLYQELPALIGKWERQLGVRVAQWRVRRMRTLWGSCNVYAKRVWFNVELAKKHRDCLDYVVAHELTHLLERSHGPRFQTLMDNNLPDWRDRKVQLDAVAHA